MAEGVRIGVWILALTVAMGFVVGAIKDVAQNETPRAGRDDAFRIVMMLLALIATAKYIFG